MTHTRFFASQPRPVAIGATGPIFEQELDTFVLPVPTYLHLLRELSLRAVDPSCDVLSTIAQGVSGTDAFLAHAYLQNNLGTRVRGLTVWEATCFAATLVGTIRTWGSGEGLEALLASTANILWRRVPQDVMKDLCTLVDDLSEQSRFMRSFPFYILERSGAIAAYDPATTLHRSDGQFTDSESLRQISAANAEEFRTGPLSDGVSAAGLTQATNWFGVDWEHWLGADEEDDHPHMSPVTRPIGPRQMFGGDDDATDEEPYHQPLTNKDRAGQSTDIEEVTVKGKKRNPNNDIIHIPDIEVTKKTEGEQASDAIVNGAKATGLAMMGSSTVAGKLLKIPSLTGMWMIGGVVWLWGAYVDALRHDDDPVHAGGKYGHWSPYETPNPLDDQGHGGYQLGWRPRTPHTSSGKLKPGPSDHGDTPFTAWRWAGAPEPASGELVVIDPLWDPAEVRFVDGNQSLDQVPPRYLDVPLHRWVYYVGPGTASLTYSLGATKVWTGS